MLLIYGFGPYLDFEDNITLEVIGRLPPELRRRSHVFDVVFDAAMFETRFADTQPRYLLGLGQTPHGNNLRIESRTVNAMAEPTTQPGPIDSRASEGQRPMSWRLPDDPACVVSRDAGTYVCNFSMWIAEDWARRNGAAAAFIHVPRVFDPGQAARYVESVALEVLKQPPADGG
jgi:pyrrolidone-carboxylate peptidase